MKRVVAVLGLVCVAGLGLGIEHVAAEPIAPKLRAKLRKKDDSVRVNWRTRKVNRRATNIIEIERAHDGGAFESLDAVNRRPGRYTDRPEEGGTYEYRARLHSDDEVSAWSNVASVDVPSEEAPPAPAPAPPPPNPGGNAPGDPNLKSGQRECPRNTVDEVLRIVNQERAAQRRSPVRLNDQLQWAARVRTIDQAHRGQLSHDGWVGVVNRSGYRWSALAENIALGMRTPAGVMNAWMNSNGHRRNILGGYREMGIGCVIDRNGFYWWTQIFGS